MEEFAHPIQQLILLDEKSPVRKFKAADEPVETTELESYILACAKGLVVLITAIEKALFSLQLLERSGTIIKDTGFTHAQQIQFAIENYMIRSATIYDRALIFIGHLLDLGVPDNNINHEAMVNNRHVKRYQLENELRALSKACREFNEERNAIIHHRSYSTETFDKFALIVSSNEISKAANMKPLFTRKVVKQLTDAVLNDHLIDFEEHFEKVKLKLSALLDTAAAVYQLRKTKYPD